MKTMKNLTPFFFSVLALLLSCNNDDDSDSNQLDFNNLIIGVWKIDSQILNGTNLSFEDECQALETTEFKNDKSFIKIELDPINGTCLDAAPSIGTWTVENKTLTLNFKKIGELTVNRSDKYEIIELTNSMLKIRIDSIDMDEDGQNDEFELQYVKQ